MNDVIVGKGQDFGDFKSLNATDNIRERVLPRTLHGRLNEEIHDFGRSSNQRQLGLNHGCRRR